MHSFPVVCTCVPRPWAPSLRGTHVLLRGPPRAHGDLARRRIVRHVGNCDDPDVCGALADVFTTARDDYGLDFVAFTDHSVADPAWRSTISSPRVSRRDDGHVRRDPRRRAQSAWSARRHTTSATRTSTCSRTTTALATLSVADFRGRRRRSRAATRCGRTRPTIAAEFGPTLEFAHHPAAGNIMVTDWSCHKQTYQPVVEIFSGWGNSLEIRTDYDVLEEPVEVGTVHEALETLRPQGRLRRRNRHPRHAARRRVRGRHVGHRHAHLRWRAHDGRARRRHAVRALGDLQRDGRAAHARDERAADAGARALDDSDAVTHGIGEELSSSREAIRRCSP